MRRSLTRCPGSMPRFWCPSPSSSALSSYTRLSKEGKNQNFIKTDTHSTSNQGILISNNSFLFWSVITFWTFRTRDHGILISNHSSRVESSANGKFTFCTIFFSSIIYSISHFSVHSQLISMEFCLICGFPLHSISKEITFRLHLRKKTSH